MAFQQSSGMGGYPAQRPDYSAAPPRPNGGTAITAGVLALLGGLWHLAGVVMHVVGMFTGPSTLARLVVAALLHAVLAGLLVIGGIMLLARKRTGRTMTITGAALALATYLADMVLRLFDLYFMTAVYVPGLRGLLLTSLFATATLVLACVAPTARWVAAGNLAPMWTPPGYPPRQW